MWHWCQYWDVCDTSGNNELYICDTGGNTELYTCDTGGNTELYTCGTGGNTETYVTLATILRRMWHWRQYWDVCDTAGNTDLRCGEDKLFKTQTKKAVTSVQVAQNKTKKATKHHHRTWHCLPKEKARHKSTDTENTSPDQCRSVTCPPPHGGGVGESV